MKESIESTQGYPTTRNRALLSQRFPNIRIKTSSSRLLKPPKGLKIRNKRRLSQRNRRDKEEALSGAQNSEEREEISLFQR